MKDDPHAEWISVIIYAQTDSLSGHALTVSIFLAQNQSTFHYRPQTKFAKVMFLQVSVCPHRGACVVLFGRGACVVLFGGHAWFYLGGVHGFIWWGMHGFIRGHAWFYSGGMRGFIQGGMHGFIWGLCVVLFGGACMVLFRGHAWFFQFFRIQ